MAERALFFADLERAFESRDPRLGALICQYVLQPDPPENAAEDHDPKKGRAPALPRDAWTMNRLRRTFGKWQMYGKGKDEKHAIRTEAWTSIMKAPHPPPRLKLGSMLLDLYEINDDWARTNLIHVFQNVRIGWGVWQGIKKIYKLAEARYDAEIFGVLAYRFDFYGRLPQTYEVQGQTFGYLRRRAWRFLRHLGRAVPELYPHFAVEVMRHYGPQRNMYGTWVLSQIWAHEDLKYATASWISSPPQDLTRRAFNDAWKITPDPLLRLIEDSDNDGVLDFAIRSLQADFAETLRSVDPVWLARIGAKKSGRIHRFVIDLLKASPDLHQSKLKGLGLHDMVLEFLKSPDAEASKYAVEYANAHAPDLDDAFLLDVARSGQEPARQFAVARFEKRPGKAIGLDLLIDMLRINALRAMAQKKIEDDFAPKDLGEDHYVSLRLGDNNQQNFVKQFYEKNKLQVPAPYLLKVVEDKRLTSHWQRNQVLQELGKHSAKDIGVEWIKMAVLDNRFSSAVRGWVTGGKLKGNDLDVEWLKGLVMRPSVRSFAIQVLSNRKLVEPHRVGLGWLLAMSRQADEQLAGFAHRYLLQNFVPSDFADGAGDEAGVARIWSLLGPKEPDPVRLFAVQYLQVHHPELGPKTDQARQLGIEPRLKSEHFGLDHLRPLFDDALPQVRRFATLVGRFEITRWGDTTLPYRLAASRHAESRRFGLVSLLTIGEEKAASLTGGRSKDEAWRPVDPLPVDWLSAVEVFALAESSNKSAREAAMSLVRRHYDKIGGATRLGWLMESPERDVRIFAVRLLWEHRGAFKDVEALRQFLRTILFGLPPGRMERRADGALAERPLPASIAKRRLVDVVRDLSVDEREFAAVALPVLEEFMSSEAKGEWHACVAALARVRRAHPNLTTTLPAAQPFATSSQVRA